MADVTDGPGMQRADGERFALAILCTANRFRSPIAAGFVRRLAAGVPVDVRSAAATGSDGRRALPQALDLAATRGVDLGAHRSRALRHGELEDADLVLGFERAHVAAAVVDGGASRERAFTMPEFVALAEAADPARSAEPVLGARGVVTAAAALRSAAPPAAVPEELADPIGGPERGYREAALALEELSRRLVDVLFRVSR